MTVDTCFINNNAYKGMCPTCGEEVGYTDCVTIMEQLRDNEKICFWCGDDFPRNDLGEIDLSMFELETIANQLNAEADHYFMSKPSKKFTMAVDKKPKKCNDFFDPKTADSQGNPRDRIKDATPYEQVIKGDIAHRILEIVKKHPNSVASDIYCSSVITRSLKFRPLAEMPLSKLVASGLLECDSKFIGYQKLSSNSHLVGVVDSVPKFTRKYKITNKGMGVLDLFDKTEREAVLL